MCQVRPVTETVAHDKSLQVLEKRLRDWMSRNSPGPSCDSWRKPFSARGAPPTPPRIAELRRPVTDVRNFYFEFLPPPRRRLCNQIDFSINQSTLIDIY